jgi:MFS family permease
VITVAMFALVVPTAMVAFAADLPALIFWRFVQGLVLPPIFVVTVAYIGEEWPTAQVVGITGTYLSATSFGGFFGRFITGVLADLMDWRSAFLALAALAAVLAVGVALLLPKERHFVRSACLRVAAVQMLKHLRNPQLLATYAIGFGVLFTFIAIFTYISFYLSAPPFNLSATLLGTLFVVYLAGVAVTPLTQRLVARFAGGRWRLASSFLDRRPRAVAHPVAVHDRRFADGVRRLRLPVPGSVDELCRRHGKKGRPRGRPVRDLHYVGSRPAACYQAWRGTWRAGGCVALVAAVLPAMAATVWFWWKDQVGRRSLRGAEAVARAGRAQPCRRRMMLKCAFCSSLNQSNRASAGRTVLTASSGLQVLAHGLKPPG